MEVQAKTLHQALVRAGKAVPSRSSLPILTHVHLSLGTDYLTITGYNLDTGIKVRVPVTNPGTFTTWEVCVPHKLFVQAVKALRGAIIVNYEETTVEGFLQTFFRVSKSTLPTMEACDYPGFPEMGPTLFSTTIPRDELLASWSGSYAASRDDSRYNKNCIRVEPGTVIATDGHRLTTRTAAWWNGPAINLPVQAVDALIKSLPENLVVATDGKYLEIKGEHFKAMVRLAEGDYPNWHKSLPEADSEVRVHRGELLQAIKALEPYFQDDKPGRCLGATLTLAEDALLLEMRHPGRGSGSGSARLGYTEVETGHLGIFNLHYIQEAVAACPEPWIAFKFQGHDASGAFIGDGNLVMPMRKDSGMGTERKLERLPYPTTLPCLHETAVVARSQPKKGKGAGRGKRRVAVVENAPQLISADDRVGGPIKVGRWEITLPSPPEIPEGSDPGPQISDLDAGKTWGLALCRWLRRHRFHTDEHGKRYPYRSLALSHRFWAVAQRHPSRALWYAGAAYGFLQGR